MIIYSYIYYCLCILRLSYLDIPYHTPILDLQQINNHIYFSIIVVFKALKYPEALFKYCTYHYLCYIPFIELNYLSLF